MKSFCALVAMLTGVAAVAPAEVHASSGAAGLLSNDLLTGVLIALGCALFSAALRRLPNG